MADVTNIFVLRGTKGRVTGWTWVCDEHGQAEQPFPNKARAERDAVAHSREGHLYAPRILTRR